MFSALTNSSPFLLVFSLSPIVGQGQDNALLGASFLAELFGSIMCPLFSVTVCVSVNKPNGFIFTIVYKCANIGIGDVCNHHCASSFKLVCGSDHQRKHLQRMLRSALLLSRRKLPLRRHSTQFPLNQNRFVIGINCAASRLRAHTQTQILALPEWQCAHARSPSTQSIFSAVAMLGLLQCCRCGLYTNKPHSVAIPLVAFQCSNKSKFFIPPNKLTVAIPTKSFKIVHLNISKKYFFLTSNFSKQLCFSKYSTTVFAISPPISNGKLHNTFSFNAIAISYLANGSSFVNVNIIKFLSNMISLHVLLSHTVNSLYRQFIANQTLKSKSPKKFNKFTNSSKKQCCYYAVLAFMCITFQYSKKYNSKLFKEEFCNFALNYNFFSVQFVFAKFLYLGAVVSLRGGCLLPALDQCVRSVAACQRSMADALTCCFDAELQSCCSELSIEGGCGSSRTKLSSNFAAHWQYALQTVTYSVDGFLITLLWSKSVNQYPRSISSFGLHELSLFQENSINPAANATFGSVDVRTLKPNPFAPKTLGPASFSDVLSNNTHPSSDTPKTSRKQRRDMYKKGGSDNHSAKNSAVNKRNRSDDSANSPSPKRVTKITRRTDVPDELFIAIDNAAVPNGALTVSQIDEIRSEMAMIIINQNPGEFGPKFEFAGSGGGQLRLRCMNRESKVWMLAQVEKLNSSLPGVKIRIRPVSELRTQLVGGFFPILKAINSDGLLKLLAIQNEKMNVALWRVVKFVERKGKDPTKPSVGAGYYAQLDVDEMSAVALKDDLYRLYFVCSAVTMRPLGKKTPNVSNMEVTSEEEEDINNVQSDAL